MGINQLIALFFGVVCLVAAGWLRSGKLGSSEWFAPKQGAKSGGQNGLVTERFALVFLPSFAVFLLDMGLLQLSVLPAQPTVKWLCFGTSIVVAVVSFVGIIWGLFPFYYPSRIRPAWLRTLYTKRHIDPDRGHIFAPK